MKRILLFMALILMMTSCWNQKFYVVGEPGTVITSMNGSKTLAIIDQNGMAEIKMNYYDREAGYQAFLQAKSPNSDVLVPFALDYKNKNRSTPNSFLAITPFLHFFFADQTGTDWDYNYLKQQHTNNDLIK